MAEAKERGVDPGRIAVTGGATNIGRAIAECFLASGATVAVGQHRSSASALVEKYGDQVKVIQLDQGDAESCRQFIAEAANLMGGLDVLVNNAAVTGPGASRAFWELDPLFVSKVVDVNLKGVIFCSVEAARVMRGQGSGVIIHISSINAFRPQSHSSVYAATKAGIGNLTQSMAKELGESGIRVVSVAPGDIWTDTYDRLMEEQRQRGAEKEVAGQAVLGQGQPRDIAETVFFLASEKARYVTGVTWIVDGGYLA